MLRPVGRIGQGVTWFLLHGSAERSAGYRRSSSATRPSAAAPVHRARAWVNSPGCGMTGAPASTTKWVTFFGKGGRYGNCNLDGEVGRTSEYGR